MGDLVCMSCQSEGIELAFYFLKTILWRTLSSFDWKLFFIGKREPAFIFFVQMLSGNLIVFLKSNFGNRLPCRTLVQISSKMM